MANYLFAQNAIPVEDFDWARLAIVAASLIVVGLVASTVVLWVRRWATKPADTVAANDMLSDFKRLKAEGELSDEEFRRIRSVLDDKIRAQAGMAPTMTEKLLPLTDESAEEVDFEWREVDLKALGGGPPPTGEQNGRNVSE